MLHNTTPLIYVLIRFGSAIQIFPLAFHLDVRLVHLHLNRSSDSNEDECVCPVLGRSSTPTAHIQHDDFGQEVPPLKQGLGYHLD
jgi:hypothetical protein